MRTKRSTPILLVLALGASCFGCDTKTQQPASGPPDSSKAMTQSIHSLRMKRIDGTDELLKAYEGKVLLVVNTASECGYTPQYEGLEKLHEKYAAKGFAVLGFPANDFGGQEPGSSQEIAAFCTSKFGVRFPMFEKVTTVGAQRSELYAMLASKLGEPKWNFHKYLVDKHGVPVRAWPSATKPDSAELATAIEEQLAAR